MADFLAMNSNLGVDEIKRVLQNHLMPGIVLIIGSGLSCAEGLPGMTALAEHLVSANETAANPPLSEKILGDIKEKGIEHALKNLEITNGISDFIRTETAKCILNSERQVVKEILTTERKLRFTKLLPHLPNNERFTVVTTNYDRLIELAAESAGFLVDTRSRGFHLAPFSKTDGAYAFAKTVSCLKGRILRKVEERCLSLYKPHGSLDWIESGGRSLRTAFDLGPDRALIITPGQNKYRAGYDQPFDMHRELANQAIDGAARLLIIGYGFNDDHLETHLRRRIESGVPTVIMAHTLTKNAISYCEKGSSIWGLEACLSGPGTTVRNGMINTSVPEENLWDVAGFVEGVLGG